MNEHPFHSGVGDFGVGHGPYIRDEIPASDMVTAKLRISSF